MNSPYQITRFFFGGGGGGGGGGFGISESFGGGGGGGTGLFGTFAVIFGGGGGGGGIDFFVCEDAFVESKIMKANVIAQKVNFPIEIFFLRCLLFPFP